MKTLVVVHVYYPQLWPELAAEMFDPPVGHMTETFAHVMERAR